MGLIKYARVTLLPLLMFGYKLFVIIIIIFVFNQKMYTFQDIAGWYVSSWSVMFLSFFFLNIIEICFPGLNYILNLRFQYRSTLFLFNVNKINKM